MNWLGVIADVLTRLFSIWWTGKKQVDAGRDAERADQASKDIKTVTERVEQKQKVDDEVNRLTSDARRERLRAWAPKPSRPSNGGG